MYFFFNPVACSFLYKAKDLSASPHNNDDGCFLWVMYQEIGRHCLFVSNSYKCAALTGNLYTRHPEYLMVLLSKWWFCIQVLLVLRTCEFNMLHITLIVAVWNQNLNRLSLQDAPLYHSQYSPPPPATEIFSSIFHRTTRATDNS
jgi:hypothetical protein